MGTSRLIWIGISGVLLYSLFILSKPPLLCLKSTIHSHCEDLRKRSLNGFVYFSARSSPSSVRDYRG